MKKANAELYICIIPLDEREKLQVHFIENEIREQLSDFRLSIDVIRLKRENRLNWYIYHLQHGYSYITNLSIFNYLFINTKL